MIKVKVDLVKVKVKDDEGEAGPAVETSSLQSWHCHSPG